MLASLPFFLATLKSSRSTRKLPSSLSFLVGYEVSSPFLLICKSKLYSSLMREALGSPLERSHMEAQLIWLLLLWPQCKREQIGVPHALVMLLLFPNWQRWNRLDRLPNKDETIRWCLLMQGKGFRGRVGKPSVRLSMEVDFIRGGFLTLGWIGYLLLVLARQCIEVTGR